MNGLRVILIAFGLVYSALGHAAKPACLYAYESKTIEMIAKSISHRYPVVEIVNADPWDANDHLAHEIKYATDAAIFDFLEEQSVFKQLQALALKGRVPWAQFIIGGDYLIIDARNKMLKVWYQDNASEDALPRFKAFEFDETLSDYFKTKIATSPANNVHVLKSLGLWMLISTDSQQSTRLAIKKILETSLIFSKPAAHDFASAVFDLETERFVTLMHPEHLLNRLEKAAEFVVKNGEALGSARQWSWNDSDNSLVVRNPAFGLRLNVILNIEVQSQVLKMKLRLDRRSNRIEISGRVLNYSLPLPSENFRLVFNDGRLEQIDNVAKLMIQRIQFDLFSTLHQFDNFDF